MSILYQMCSLSNLECINSLTHQVLIYIFLLIDILNYGNNISVNSSFKVHNIIKQSINCIIFSAVNEKINSILTYYYLCCT